MLATQAQPQHRPWWDPAGSGSLPAGVWPEGPVWFEFLVPLTPCTSPQPGSELPGLRLIWVLSPPRQHSAALKGRPGGQRGAVALPAPEPLQLHLPLGQPISPAVEKTRPPKTRPARQPAPGGGGDRGGLRKRASRALPGSRSPSVFHLKPGLDSLQCLLTKWGRERVDSNVAAAIHCCAGPVPTLPASALAPAWEIEWPYGPILQMGK